MPSKPELRKNEIENRRESESDKRKRLELRPLHWSETRRMSK